ncbi:MAG: sigma factor regulation protein, partial [Flavobacteriales bacterium]|nr:sigma factor regulation protein [Flavobacteriales bacterium]
MTAKITRLTEKLKDKDFKLVSLLEITQAINANVPTEKLLALYQQTLRDSLGIGKLILFAKQETWECVLKFGIDGEIPNVTDEAFFNQKSAIGLDVKGATEKETFDIVIPVDQDGVP